MKESLITPAGLSRLNAELDRLRTTGRQEIAERIRNAISTEADASASADYLDAREQQMRHEVGIARLEQRLASVRVAEPDAGNDVVDLGERVRLRDLDTGARHEYELVGSLEADPAAGRISADSPVGQALIGRRRGEVALVEAPIGKIRFRILEIEGPWRPSERHTR